MAATSFKLGFVGLGSMGAQTAGQWLDGGQQTVVSTLGKLAPEVAAAGTTPCANAQAVAGLADVAFSMLPVAPDVEAVLTGDNSAAVALSTGETVADMRSISPIKTEVYANKGNALGCDHFDAAVSGGELRAKAANQAIMVEREKRRSNARGRWSN